MASFEAFFATTLHYYSYDRLNPYLVYMAPVTKGLVFILAHLQRILIFLTLVYAFLAQLIELYSGYLQTGDYLQAIDTFAYMILEVIALEICWTMRTKSVSITRLISDLHRMHPGPAALERINAKQVLDPLTWAFKNFQRAYGVALVLRVLTPVAKILNEYLTTGNLVLRLPLRVWYPFDPYRPLRYGFVYIFEVCIVLLSTWPLIMVSAFLGGLTTLVCVQLKQLALDFRHFIPRNGTCFREDLRHLGILVQRHGVLLGFSDELNQCFGSFLLCNYVFCSIGLSMFMFGTVAARNTSTTIEYAFVVISYTFYIGALSLFGQSLIDHVSCIL